MTAAACAALGVSRASVQRRRARLTASPAIRRPRPRPARALTAPQQQIVLDLLHAPRFADQAPAEIYASLLVEQWLEGSGALRIGDAPADLLAAFADFAVLTEHAVHVRIEQW